MKFKNKLIIILIVISLFVAVLFAFEVGNYKRYLSTVKSVCKTENIKTSLILAMIKTESNFNEHALSNKGAKGLMQIMPATAEYIAKLLDYKKDYDLYNFKDNIYLGVKYYKYLLNKFGDEELALYAYNAGEGVVLGWLQEGLQAVPYKETRNYYNKISYRRKVYKLLIGE